ncbi:hypothetical protein QYF36_020064 [Acer negundo]|nr:hypothetical protein QYF36_020064 [Acer negundo]
MEGRHASSLERTTTQSCRRCGQSGHNSRRCSNLPMVNEVQEAPELSPEKLVIANVGRQDARKHLEEHVSNLMSSNIVQTLEAMLDTVVL